MMSLILLDFCGKFFYIVFVFTFLVRYCYINLFNRA
nr:hypothetical protein RU989_pgp151 [Laurencia obtusa]WMP12860.1 hypothetical protein [Laurencia obtusa]